MNEDPRISVVIPTFNRVGLLCACLSSFSRQTLAPQHFEVIVVDDGSTDGTAAGAVGELPVRYYRTGHAGTSAAKNLGLFLARAPLVLFFDDDDVATPNLLDEHLAGHRDHPDEGVAVLGHTGWAADLPVTYLMHYLTEVDPLLYDYNALTDGATLDYRYFWAGRLSCKRAFLVHRGLFRSAFDIGLEDIELGRRLEPAGLRVVYKSAARQATARPVTLDEFLARSTRHGLARRLFAAAYPGDPSVRDYCKIRGGPDRWVACSDAFNLRVSLLRRLEARLGQELNPQHLRLTIDELYQWYGWCFRGAMQRGAAEHGAAPSGPTGPQSRARHRGAVQPRPAAAPPLAAQRTGVVG